MIRLAPEEGGQSTKTILFLTVNHSLGSPACNDLHCHSLHTGSIFFSLSAFLGLSGKTEGRTNRWMNCRNKNNSANSPAHLREHIYEEEPLKGKGQGSPTTSVSRKTRPGCGQCWQDESPPSHPRSSLEGKISTLLLSSSSSSLTAAQIVLTVS